jgi:5-(carboxyamino)imidazole ribonucleotide synthase
MTVGIVGAGQLGRMLAIAGYPLGLDFLFLDPSDKPPAAALAPHLKGAFDDDRLLTELAERSDIITFDWENVSVKALRALSGRTRICPPLAALGAAQDRVSEKRLFERLKIPTTRWRAVDSLAQLKRAVREIGLPGVLKTRRFGYDGKGQAVVVNLSEIESAWQQLGASPLLYEERIAFSHEVSIIGARSRRGEVAIYPLNGNVHNGGILRLTRAPYGPPAWQLLAERYLARVLAHFRYVGILAIEFFVQRGRLIANEMAPRVHNSGHWTIEGALTSQLESPARNSGVAAGCNHGARALRHD